MEDVLSVKSKSKWLILVLLVIITVDVIAIFVDFSQIELINRVADGELISDAEAEQSDSYMQIVGIVQFALLLLGAVTFFIWEVQIYKNIISASNVFLTFTKGRMIGNFFIPFIALYKPYQNMKELWTETNNLLTDQNEQTSIEPVSSDKKFLIPLWWAFFIITSFLGAIIFRMSSQLETLDKIFTFLYLTLASDISDIVAATFLILLVITLTAKHELLFNKMQQSGLSSDPIE